MRIARFLLPALLLVLAGGCHKSSNHASDPGTPPTITSQPVDVSTVAGRPALFVVGAQGAPVLRYQWAKVQVDSTGKIIPNSGVAILGAISASFTLFDPQPTDSGNYAVTITNPNGHLDSYAAVLKVAPALAFTAPVGVVSDAAGNLYVSDRADHAIWKVDASKHVSLLAGVQGVPGSVDTAPGVTALFRNPSALALDPTTGNLLVADTGNSTIRQIAPNGTVTTLAGTAGMPGAVDAKGALARFNAPSGLAVVVNGGVYGGAYIADSQNHTIRFLATDGTVSTYAGMAGQPGHTDASGTSAQFDQPTGLALAASGTLYVADYGSSCIRKVASGAQVSTLSGVANTPGFINGGGTIAEFNQPAGIALDATGNLWVADTYNHVIRMIAPDGTTSGIAGAGSLGNADGTNSTALFDLPSGITAVTSSGNLVVADTANHMLRQVTPTGVVTTL